MNILKALFLRYTMFRGRKYNIRLLKDSYCKHVKFGLLKKNAILTY